MGTTTGSFALPLPHGPETGDAPWAGGLAPARAGTGAPREEENGPRGSGGNSHCTANPPAEGDALEGTLLTQKQK